MGNPPSRSDLLNEDKGGPARSHRRRVRWQALTLALAGVLLLAAGQTAHAATFTVTKTTDDNGPVATRRTAPSARRSSRPTPVSARTPSRSKPFPAPIR